MSFFCIFLQRELFKNKDCLIKKPEIYATMENFLIIPDFQTLIEADRVPLSYNLDEQLAFSGLFTDQIFTVPPVLNRGLKIPADDTPQRRLDQFSIKPVIPSCDPCLVSAHHSSHQELSFLESPSSAPSQPELSKTPSTSVFLQPEDIEAEVEKFTPLVEAKAILQLALKNKAPWSKINRLRNRVNNAKRDGRRLAQLKKLEENLSPQLITLIKNERNKCNPDKKEQYDFVMRHLEKRVDKRLTKKYTLVDLCNAIVHDIEINFEDTEQRVMFRDCRSWAKRRLSAYKYQKLHEEYIRLLQVANKLEK